MPVEEDVRTAREAVEDAIDELHSSGFHRAELSLVYRKPKSERGGDEVRLGWGTS